MTTETMQVPEIHCDHCVTSIEGAVGDLDGVEDVSVSIDDRTVAVDYDESTVDRSRIVDAIEGQGYAVDV